MSLKQTFKEKKAFEDEQTDKWKKNARTEEETGRRKDEQMDMQPLGWQIQRTWFVMPNFY